MFNHRFSSSLIYTNQRKEGKNQGFLLKRNILNRDHNSWDLSHALYESDVIIFLSFTFFPTFFLECSQGSAYLAAVPSSGSLCFDCDREERPEITLQHIDLEQVQL